MSLRSSSQQPPGISFTLSAIGYRHESNPSRRTYNPHDARGTARSFRSGCNDQTILHVLVSSNLAQPKTSGANIHKTTSTENNIILLQTVNTVSTFPPHHYRWCDRYLLKARTKLDIFPIQKIKNQIFITLAVLRRRRSV